MTTITQKDLIERGFIQTNFQYSGDFEKFNDRLGIGISIDYEYVNEVDIIRDIIIYSKNGQHIYLQNKGSMPLEDLDHLIRILNL